MHEKLFSNFPQMKNLLIICLSCSLIYVWKINVFKFFMDEKSAYHLPILSLIYIPRLLVCFSKDSYTVARVWKWYDRAPLINCVFRFVYAMAYMYAIGLWLETAMAYIYAVGRERVIWKFSAPVNICYFSFFGQCRKKFNLLKSKRTNQPNRRVSP